MADIKQAVHWLISGNDVQRKGCPRWWLSPCEGNTFAIVCIGTSSHTINTFDLLAEDWELRTITNG